MATIPIIGDITIGGTAKNISGGYVNIGGVWKPIVKTYVNVGGVWKPAWKELYTWKKYLVADVEGAPYTEKQSTSTSTRTMSNTVTVYLCNSYTFSSTTGFTMNSPTTTTVSTLRGSSATQYISTEGTKNLMKLYKIQSVSSSGSSKIVRYWLYSAVGTITQAMGDYIEDVTSEIESTYPDNGIHTDGYWYVKQEG